MAHATRMLYWWSYSGAVFNTARLSTRQRRVARAGRTENDGGCNECIHCSACMAPFGVRVLQAGSALHCSPSPSPSPSPPQGRCILNGDLNWYDLTSLLVLFLVGGGGIDDAESLDG